MPGAELSRPDYDRRLEWDDFVVELMRCRRRECLIHCSGDVITQYLGRHFGRETMTSVFFHDLNEVTLAVGRKLLFSETVLKFDRPDVQPAITAQPPATRRPRQPRSVSQ